MEKGMQSVLDVIAHVVPLDRNAMEQARQRQETLTKPLKSLGRLEDLAIQLAGIQHKAMPEIEKKSIILMAGDHGVTCEGVSAYPAAVTPQMVYNFLQGRAAINALARQIAAHVVIVDIGVATDIQHPALASHKIAPGTANMAVGPAMTRIQMLDAIQVGIDVLATQVMRGLDIVAIGEMGIGNTTAASAITAAVLQCSVTEVTGRGTGLNDEQFTHKIEVIERALATNRPDARDPFDILAKVGGLEIAGLVGVILNAAAQRIPVVIDGFITGAAALLAVEMCPTAGQYLIAGHTSVEPGHRLILEYLQLQPLLNLGMRLGEGSGAALAMNIIEGAVRTHTEMVTFAEAGVSNRKEEV